ncbi:hypothetical protein FTX61_04855 [Nitriliruptoraceae bacterium ZYF776]|nr:hypothetical protein [Profundirhabdus halotolerans]
MARRPRARPPGHAVPDRFLPSAANGPPTGRCRTPSTPRPGLDGTSVPSTPREGDRWSSAASTSASSARRRCGRDARR